MGLDLGLLGCSEPPAECTTPSLAWRWSRGGGFEEEGGGLMFLKCSLWPFENLGFTLGVITGVVRFETLVFLVWAALCVWMGYYNQAQ